MKKSPFLGLIRTEPRTRHYNYRTEKTYILWVKDFIRFNDKRHLASMGNAEIECYLNYLATHRKVSPATQNLALCVLIFIVMLSSKKLPI